MRIWSLYSCTKDHLFSLLAIWRLSVSCYCGTFFAPLGDLLVMKTLEDEWYIAIKAYVSLYYHIMCICAIPTYRVYQLYDSVLSHKHNSNNTELIHLHFKYQSAMYPLSWCHTRSSPEQSISVNPGGHRYIQPVRSQLPPLHGWHTMCVGSQFDNLIMLYILPKLFNEVAFEDRI